MFTSKLSKRLHLRHPSAALVLATAALFFAVSGSAIAKHAIHTIHYISGGVIAPNSITSKQIKDGSLTSVDFHTGTIQTGPAGRTGATGPAGPTGATGPAGDPGRSALSPLRSGESVRGAWAVSGTAAGQGLDAVTLPIPAPTPIDSLHVVVANNDTISGDGCTGTAAAPVSAPGFVCIYGAESVNTTQGGGYGANSPDIKFTDSAVATGDGTTSGFLVLIAGTTTSWSTSGTWIYTAP